MIGLLLCLLLTPADRPPGQVAYDRGLAHLRASEHPQAVRSLEKALWWNPSFTAVYKHLAVAYEETEENDLALYYSILHLNQLTSADKPDRGAITAARKRISALRPDSEQTGAGRTGDLKRLIGLTDGYFRKKKYQTAAHWMTLYLELGGDPKTVAAMQRKIAKATTGGAALKLQRRLASRSPGWIARQDRQHRSWSKAYKERTRKKHYTIKTNVGYEVFQNVYWSMDQMNAFYHEIFDYRGGDPPVLTVSMFRTRKGFEDHGSITQRTVRGYYNSSEIVTYDLRVDNFETEDIYTTLFHEASHQFIDLITGTRPPMYLNEGISSYFEGARILPSGEVQTNLLPPNRIRTVAATLGTDRELSLRELITAVRGQYDVDHYCYGWALIYYLLNKENDEAQAPYRKPLMKLLGKYKKGGKHDVVGRFEQMVLAPVAGPKTIDALDPEWKQWLRELYTVYRQGPGATDHWIERSEWYLEKGRFDLTEEALRRVLAWNPEHARAWLLLSRTFEATRDADRALHALIQARRHGEGDEQALKKLDPLFDQRVALENSVREATIARARGLFEHEMPRAALLDLEEYERVFGTHVLVSDLMDEIGASGAALTSRWSLFRGTDLDNWTGRKNAATMDGTGFLFETSNGMAVLRETGEYSAPYRVVLDASEPGGNRAILGIAYGWKAGEQGYLVALNQSPPTILDGKFKFEHDPNAGWIAQPMPAGVPTLLPELPAGTMVLDVTPSHLTFSIGDQVVFEKELTPGSADGQVGIVLESGSTRINSIDIETRVRSGR